MTEDERVARLVHDLRTPLTVVTGFAELLARGAPALSDEQRTEYLERITGAAQEMREILDAERAGRLG